MLSEQDFAEESGMGKYFGIHQHVDRIPVMGLKKATWGEMLIENNRGSNLEQANFWTKGRRGRVTSGDRFRKNAGKMQNPRSLENIFQK